MNTLALIETPFLQQLSQRAIIPATKGERTFAAVGKDFFRAYYDPNFRDWKTHQAYLELGPTPTNIFQMKKPGSFKQILASFSNDETLPFWESQDQIISFAEHHFIHLDPNGWGTYFPFVVQDKTYMARIGKNQGANKGFEAYLYRFDDPLERTHLFDSRFVLPVTK